MTSRHEEGGRGRQRRCRRRPGRAAPGLRPARSGGAPAAMPLENNLNVCFGYRLAVAGDSGRDTGRRPIQASPAVQGGRDNNLHP